LAKIIKALIAVAAAFILVFIFHGAYKEYKAAYNRELTGTYTDSGNDIMVVIPDGATERQIAAILKADGLIKYPSAFQKRLNDSKYDGKLVGGTYNLNTGMNTLDMMKAMAKTDDVSPDGVIATLVVPEGFTIDQIAERCEKQKICSAESFINAVKSVTKTDFSYLADVPEGVDVRYKLEGYLFPATYTIYNNTTAADLVEQMLDTFKANYTSEMQAEAEGMGYTSYDVITRASMIEREAKIDAERPMIASVIENRLKNNMLLQIDSTVLYAVTDGNYDKATVTDADTAEESSYNTYLNKGLPAGPICNPGTACINAVLSPSPTKFLFYHVINKNTGEHGFFETQEAFTASFENGDTGVTAATWASENDASTEDNKAD